MKYRTKIVNDSEFIKRFNGFIQSLNGTLEPSGAATLHFGKKEDPKETFEGPLNLDVNALESNALATSELYTVERLTLMFRPKGHGNNNRDVRLRIDNRQTYFYVRLEFDNHSVEKSEDILQLSGPLQSNFPRLEISPYIDNKVEQLIVDLQTTRDAISAKTEKAIGDLTAAIANTHKQSTDRIDELSRNREQHYEELAEKHRIKVESEEGRIAKLEDALRDKEAALNLKEPIGERRKIHEELRGKLLEQVKSFGPSKTVTKSRWAVRLSNWAVMGGALAAFIYFANTGHTASISDSSQSLLLYYYIKLTASAAIFFGFGAGYIRWEIRWLDKMTDTEFQLRDKAIDVERSAWLVETVEALNYGKVQLPDGFLQLLGNNLFEPQESKETEAENLSKFLEQLIGKKGEFEAQLPGGGSVKINAEGTKPK